MSLLLFNKGGSATVTATATDDPATDLVVTLSSDGKRSESFTTAGAGTAAATATAFIAAHAVDIAEKFGVAVLAGDSAEVAFFGMGSLSISVTGGSVTTDASTELAFSMDAIVSLAPTSATAIAITLDEAKAPAASDVCTLTFVSATDRKKFEDAYQDAVRRQSRNQGVIEFDVPARAEFP